MIRAAFFPTLWALVAVVSCAGEVPTGPSIRSEEFIELNGVKQYLLIRGDDVTRNPVLLFVHGGPGFPGGIFVRRNAELERDFTVVHWDQRGAGHSYQSGPLRETMTVDQFASDTVALSRWLAKRFGRRRIILVGHSWGTMVAALAVARAPACFEAFVSVSQLSNYRESQRVLAAGTPRGPPTLRVGNPRILWWTLTSPEYSPWMLPSVLAGYGFTVGALEKEIVTTDLSARIKTLDVPVWFFAGAHDNVVGEVVIREFYERLRAPRGKHYVRFENSRHWPHLQEPEKFAAEMRKVRRAVWPGAETKRPGMMARPDR